MARWIAAQGYEAEHVHDFAGDGASDHFLWLYAANVDAVIISKDEDFVRLHFIESEGSSVVWIRGIPENRLCLNGLVLCFHKY